MKRFEELNYYEILEIPVDASLSQIRRACRHALEVYGENSLLTYSLFTAEERDAILKRIQDAYDTLSDRTKRMKYDEALRGKSGLAHTL